MERANCLLTAPSTPQVRQRRDGGTPNIGPRARQHSETNPHDANQARSRTRPFGGNTFSTCLEVVSRDRLRPYLFRGSSETPSIDELSSPIFTPTVRIASLRRIELPLPCTKLFPARFEGWVERATRTAAFGGSYLASAWPISSALCIRGSRWMRRKETQ